MKINAILHLSRKIRNYFERKKLRNDNFTIISQNCIGSLIYSDLDKRFNSPTINLFMDGNDFVKFCENLKYYIDINLTFIDTEYQYPVGKLDDITLHFVHYKNKEEAKKKWDLRKIRINYENLFFIMTDRDDCSEEIVRRFDNIKIK